MTGKPPKSSEARNVLVAVSGQTPAIITETLWALEQQREVRIDEIRVITTAEGRKSIAALLFGENGGFSCYCKDYRVPPGRISFSEKSIHVLRDTQGAEIEDIRSSLHNESAADQVFSLIQEWCKRKDEVLFCSVAGGRKTLGIYLTMSLMLSGRLEDSLSHVLVGPEFESRVREFFYPPPETRLYQRLVRFDSEGKAVYESVSSDEAGVELADIPFLRLREMIGGELPLEEGLTGTVAHSQLLLAYLQAPPPLAIHLDSGRVTLGDLSFHLSRQLRAVYAFFLIKFNKRKSRATLEKLHEHRHLISNLERQSDRLKHAEHERYAWQDMNDIDDFRARIGPCISKVNHSIDAAFGKNRLAAQYKISTGRSYGVTVSNHQILGIEAKERIRQDLQ